MNAFHDVNVSTKLCWWTWWLFMKADRERLGRRTSYTNVLPGSVNDYIVLRAPCCPHLGFWLWVSCDNLHFDWYWPRLDAVLVLPSRPSAETERLISPSFSTFLHFWLFCYKYNAKCSNPLIPWILKCVQKSNKTRLLVPLHLYFLLLFHYFPHSLAQSRNPTDLKTNFPIFS